MELVRHINRFSGVSWNWDMLSFHPSVNLRVLKKLRDKPWNWSILTRNPKFVWMWVQEFPEKQWDWNYISSHSSFTWEWVRDFPKAPWNWTFLSKRIVDINTVKEFPDARWDWLELTMCQQITTNDMINNQNLPWLINELLFDRVDDDIIRFLRIFRSHYDRGAWQDHTSRTPWKLLKRNMDLPWDLFYARIDNDFSENDIRILYENKNSLNWKYLSEVLDFSKIISMCPDLPWDFLCVSRNKSVTYRDVLNFPYLNWNHSLLCLDCDRREWNAANTIKRYWNKCVTDPDYRMCKKIVLGDLMNISVRGNDICENQGHTEQQNTLYS